MTPSGLSQSEILFWCDDFCKAATDKQGLSKFLYF